MVASWELKEVYWKSYSLVLWTHYQETSFCNEENLSFYELKSWKSDSLPLVCWFQNFSLTMFLTFSWLDYGIKYLWNKRWDVTMLLKSHNKLYYSTLSDIRNLKVISNYQYLLHRAIENWLHEKTVAISI